MSTILKALKRIDQTTPPPDDLQSWPRRIDTKEAVRGRLLRIWLKRKVVLALILGVVVIAAGWLVYSQKHRFISKSGPSQSEKPAVFHAKIKPSARKPERPVAQQTAPLDQQMPPSAAKSKRDQVSVRRPPAESPQFPPEPKSKRNPEATARPSDLVPKPTPSERSDRSRSSTTGTRSSDRRQRRTASVAPGKKSTSRPVVTYQQLDNAKLKLQAIAWSNDAAQRIAVINDRIVREGESIEGFSINQIRQDDVIVNDGRQSWQLEFGLR